MISEGMRCFIWIVFIIYDLYVILDYEMNKEVRFDKSRKSRKKSRNSSSGKGRNDHLSLIWNDLDRFYDGHK